MKRDRSAGCTNSTRFINHMQTCSTLCVIWSRPVHPGPLEAAESKSGATGRRARTARRARGRQDVDSRATQAQRFETRETRRHGVPQGPPTGVSFLCPPFFGQPKKGGPRPGDSQDLHIAICQHEKILRLGILPLASPARKKYKQGLPSAGPCHISCSTAVHSWPRGR